MASPQLDRDAALALWREALLAGVRQRGPDLSSRQMAVLPHKPLIRPESQCFDYAEIRLI